MRNEVSSGIENCTFLFLLVKSIQIAFVDQAYTLKYWSIHAVVHRHANGDQINSAHWHACGWKNSDSKEINVVINNYILQYAIKKLGLFHPTSLRVGYRKLYWKSWKCLAAIYRPIFFKKFLASLFLNVVALSVSLNITWNFISLMLVPYFHILSCLQYHQASKYTLLRSMGRISNSKKILEILKYNYMDNFNVYKQFYSGTKCF